MIKKINFISHVGYGKTGTTYIQNKLKKYDNTLYVSSNKKLNKLLNLLINSQKQYAVKGFSNPSHTSAKTINQFIEEVAKQIKKKKIINIIISNESIGDYGNSIGEWNIFLQIALGNSLEKKFNGTPYKINKTLCFTIRNQVEIIKSLVGYGEHIDVKDVDDFLYKFGSNKYESWMGGYFYYSNIRMFEIAAGNSWKFKVIPFEILSIDQNPKKMIESIIGASIGKKMLYNLNSKINTNYFKNTPDKKIYKDRNFFTTLGVRFIIENKSFYITAKKRKLIISIIFSRAFLSVGRLLYKIGYTIIKIKKFLLTKGPIPLEISNKTIKKIQNIYVNDNKNLTRYISKSNLIKYRYINKD